MKKQLTALLTTALLLTSLTGCDRNEKNSSSENSISDNSSVADTSSAVTSDSSSESENSTDSTSSAENSVESTTTSEAPTEVVRVRYGEAEIPDIPCGDANHEGRAHDLDDEQALNNALEFMIFETHTIGEYTINLVGERVRTDSANFPDRIFAHKLYVELAKNGTPIEGAGQGYSSATSYFSQFLNEEIIFKDKIGSYVDVYELQRPVIAMRYFYPDDGREIKSFVQFSEIHNDNTWGGRLGIHSPNTGIMINGGPDLMINTGSGEYNDIYGGAEDISTVNSDLCLISLFASDEFTVVDSKTLEDKTAGIRYTFNFTNPPEMVLYSTTLV